MDKTLSYYEMAQIVQGQSYEEENDHWREGKKKSIDLYLVPLLKSDS
jgi:hypothetical protein